MAGQRNQKAKTMMVLIFTLISRFCFAQPVVNLVSIGFSSDYMPGIGNFSLIVSVDAMSENPLEVRVYVWFPPPLKGQAGTYYLLLRFNRDFVSRLEVSDCGVTLYHGTTKETSIPVKPETPDNFTLLIPVSINETGDRKLTNVKVYVYVKLYTSEPLLRDGEGNVLVLYPFTCVETHVRGKAFTCKYLVNASVSVWLRVLSTFKLRSSSPEPMSVDDFLGYRLYDFSLSRLGEPLRIFYDYECSSKVLTSAALRSALIAMAYLAVLTVALAVVKWRRRV